MSKLSKQYFGAIKKDKNIEMWIGKQKLTSGQTFIVYLNTKAKPSGKLLNTFITSFDSLKKNESRLKKIAAKRLSHIYHEYGWSSGKKLSLDKFMNQMKPKEVSLYLDGSGDIIYNDGGLFQGHSIYIGFNKNGTFKSTSFEG